LVGGGIFSEPAAWEPIPAAILTILLILFTKLAALDTLAAVVICGAFPAHGL
jgi:hypothetical protein